MKARRSCGAEATIMQWRAFTILWVGNGVQKNTDAITNNLNTIDMETMVVVNNKTQRRANVIYKRTQSMEMGVIKSLLIDTLKAKLRSGVAHFVYLKKDGSLREAWGTTSHNLIKANVNGRGIDRDSVNCVCYWDVEKGGFRSLRFENLVQVF